MGAASCPSRWAGPSRASRSLLVGVLGGKAKWEALGRQWGGQRVRVTGDVRSMDIYLRPLRHLLLFASHVEALP
jgi:hypothetical protein